MELSIEQAERLPALPPWIIYNFDLGEFSARVLVVWRLLEVGL